MNERRFTPDHIETLKHETRLEIAPPKKLQKLIQPKPNQIIADLGSGPGLFTQKIAPKTQTTLAIDVQPKMLKHLPKKPKNIKPIQANANKLPLKNNILDTLYGITVLHEIKPEKPLKELKRVLKPNGTLLMIDFKKDPKITDGPPQHHRQTQQEAKNYIETHFKIQKTGSMSKKTYYIKATKT